MGRCGILGCSGAPRREAEHTAPFTQLTFEAPVFRKALIYLEIVDTLITNHSHHPHLLIRVIPPGNSPSLQHRTNYGSGLKV